MEVPTCHVCGHKCDASMRTEAGYYLMSFSCSRFACSRREKPVRTFRLGYHTRLFFTEGGLQEHANEFFEGVESPPKKTKREVDVDFDFATPSPPRDPRRREEEPSVASLTGFGWIDLLED